MALIVKLVFTNTGEVYNVPMVFVGVDPSVVYLIDAPVVEEVYVTFCELPKVAPFGDALFNFACRVYDLDVISESRRPSLVAKTLIVCDVLTAIDVPVYLLLAFVGVLPSVV